MDGKHSSSGQRANRRARERLKKAERGESAEELNQMDAADDGAAVSAEQEAADGPEGRWPAQIRRMIPREAFQLPPSKATLSPPDQPDLRERGQGK